MSVGMLGTAASNWSKMFYQFLMETADENGH
jgi:hypothetical protein